MWEGSGHRLSSMFVFLAIFGLMSSEAIYVVVMYICVVRETIHTHILITPAEYHRMRKAKKNYIKFTTSKKGKYAIALVVRYYTAIFYTGH
jgi:hypothetical protein